MPDPKSDSTKNAAPKPAARPAAKSGAAKPTAKPAATPVAAKPAERPAATPVAAKPADLAVTQATGAQAAAAKTVSAVSAEDANPLHRKLRLRAEDKGVVIAPPQDDDNPLLPLPKSFVVLSQTSELASLKGPFDYMHVFARDRADLAETLPQMSEKLAAGGSLWISWMKPSSKMKGGGQPGDLNENLVRRIGLTRGLVDVNLVVLDRDWSALRLVRRKH